MARGSKSHVEAFSPYVISMCQHWAMKNLHLLCLLPTQTQSLVAALGSPAGLPVPFFLPRSAGCSWSGTREHSPHAVPWGASAWVTCVPGAECQEDGAGLCSVVPSSRSGGNGQKPMHRKFHLNTRKNILHRVNDRGLEQGAHRGCGLSLTAGIQELMRSCAMCPGRTLLEREGC